MPPDPALSPSPPDHGATRIARVLAIAGGLVVVGLAGLVTTSVLLRWFGGQGINGDFEMVQMGLALAVFAFLPLCQAHHQDAACDREHPRDPRRPMIRRVGGHFRIGKHGTR